MTDISIRIGTPDDLDGMMHIATLATEENGFLPPNHRKMAEMFYPALCRDHGMIGIIGEVGSIEAAVLLRIDTMWYSDAPFLHEYAIFVHPDFRNARGGRATKLCEWSKFMADGLGLPLMIGVLSNARTEAKTRLYKRHFGEPAGAFFLYGAKTGAAPTAEAAQ